MKLERNTERRYSKQHMSMSNEKEQNSDLQEKRVYIG